MSEVPLRKRILALMQRTDYRPLDKVELSKKLGIKSSERRGVRELLRTMEAEGEIARIRKDRYILPATADLVTGRIHFHHNGNAHVIDERTGQPDIVIFAANTGTAMHRDRVVARREHQGRAPREGARIEGRVIRILERANDTVVGTLQQTRMLFYVLPDDPRMQHDIAVPKPGHHGKDRRQSGGQARALDVAACQSGRRDHRGARARASARSGDALDHPEI